MTKDVETVTSMLIFIRKLVKTEPEIGRSLRLYYKQFLPQLNWFLLKRNASKSQSVGRDQDGLARLSKEIDDTLEALEATGGEVGSLLLQDAFIYIKYMIPTFEHVRY